jgi:hypothetical protein
MYERRCADTRRQIMEARARLAQRGIDIPETPILLEEAAPTTDRLHTLAAAVGSIYARKGGILDLKTESGWQTLHGARDTINIDNVRVEHLDLLDEMGEREMLAWTSFVEKIRARKASMR